MSTDWKAIEENAKRNQAPPSATHCRNCPHCSFEPYGMRYRCDAYGPNLDDEDDGTPIGDPLRHSSCVAMGIPSAKVVAVARALADRGFVVEHLPPLRSLRLALLEARTRTADVASRRTVGRAWAAIDDDPRPAEHVVRDYVEGLRAGPAGDEGKRGT